MATELQKKLAIEIINNAKSRKPKNKQEMLESVGYSKSVALAKPGEILEQKGVKEALEELGFTVEGADKVVANLLYKGKKEETKLKAAQEVYKRLGAYAEGTDKGGTTNNFIFVGDEQRAAVARRAIARLRGSEELPGGLPDSNQPEV